MPKPESNATFSKTMSGLFLACGHPEVGEEALEFVRNFCKRAFALELERPDATKPQDFRFSPDGGRSRRHLPLTTALEECFVDTLSSARADQRDGLCNVFLKVIADFRQLSSSIEPSGKFDPIRSAERMLYQIAQRFAQLCHEEEWSRKMAGVAAIGVFVHKLELGRKLLLDLEIEFIRALLYALRDAPREPPRSAGEVLDLMKHIIKTCQGADEGRIKMQRLTETLVIELNSQSELSRKAAQTCLDVLAETTGQPTPDIVAPAAKSKLLDLAAGPIYSKPLRALPFPMQVGNIEAMTYLLELRPTFIETNEEFVRLLHEVLALADVDDASLISKPATHKQETWLKTLRISCLRLLRSTMFNPDFLNKPNLSPIRSRIIQVYFKHVYSANSEIVDIAHEGLRDVLQYQNKLPKEVLQTGLRPILVNLADAKRLSVSGLDGLARFLELLTNYFKVEIGVKLLDHFETLGDHQMLSKAAFSPLEDNPDIARMTRLVNIFRLLPATAVQYLNNLTTRVVEVEALLHQSAPGPFTDNFAKYLDRYHTEAAQNLFDNVTNPRFVWTFRNIIASGLAPQLVETLSNRAEEICKVCFGTFENNDTIITGLELIRELSLTSPTWLSERENVLEALVGVWRTILTKARNPKSDMTSVAYQQMPALLLDMLMDSLKQQPHIPLLFHVVEAFEIRSSFERSHVAFFLYQQVALQDSVDYRRDVIEQFFTLYEDDSVTWAFKTNALRLIINPTLRQYFADPTNDGSLVSAQLVQKIAGLMWRPLAITSTARQREDTLLIEVYALTTLLVEHCSAKVSDARKDVFKLAWMGINLLEPTVKLMAYVLTARFMATFDTPIKFVRLTWTGLLRLKDNESRALYRQAIGILASSLPVRDPPSGTGTPEWAQRVRSVLIEEGHATGQLVTVCELLVNHPDLFYDYRELYVPQVASSLHKLAFVPAATPEMKRLTVDIVELIYKWEKRRMAAKEEAMDVEETSTRRTRQSSPEPSPHKKQRIDRAGTAISSASGHGWATPSQVRESVTAHLLRLVATSSDPVARGGLTKRGLDLFKEILGPKGLPNVTVKLNFFQRTMTQVSLQPRVTDLY